MDQNLREQVVEQVRAEIISGQSAPGTMYSVPSLAASLGVSTTPVREALLELARIGLIEPMRNRGFKVMEPTLTELRNLFDLREVLEVHAARIIARDPARDLFGLRPLADEIARAVEKEDVRFYLEADRRFHRAFTDAAGNALLTETVMGLRDKMRLYGIASRTGHERQAESVAEHFLLLDLAGAGDVEGVANLLQRHIRSWEPIFADALTRTARDVAREPIGR
ncbi:GntR family transcriptional regulator [Roseixanthobacter pseudopolyaromaticivorans]|uniref:GntR family transcriptional regulator n=1 Tax=Xanthobacteraceae TaxID=335928 RepID=UPI003727425E